MPKNPTALVNGRYLVGDVAEAVDFYTSHLGTSTSPWPKAIWQPRSTASSRWGGPARQHRRRRDRAGRPRRRRVLPHARLTSVKIGPCRCARQQTTQRFIPDGRLGGMPGVSRMCPSDPPSEARSWRITYWRLG
jgi:hypothetical protein